MPIVRVAIEESGAAVTFDPLPVVSADSGQIIRLFQNLIGNAIKYCGQSGPAVHVSAKREGDEWLFSVADKGIGIDPQFYARIFQIFQRLHKRDEYPGTGIGLAVCKKIVDRHGGRIWVKSELPPTSWRTSPCTAWVPPLSDITLLCDAAVALIFYELLKPVGRSLALLAAFFRLIFVAIMAVNSLNLFVPLVLLKGEQFLSAFTTSQLQAVALVSQKLYGVGYGISLVFFGFHCVLIGYLIFRSAYLPQILGALVAAAGLSHLTNSFAHILSPAVRCPIYNPTVRAGGILTKSSRAATERGDLYRCDQADARSS